MGQLTLNLEPHVVDRFPTLRDFVAFRSTVVPKAPKAQAADMDMSPSTLSRKLHPTDDTGNRLNVDDLEAWLRSTGDAAAVVEYLAAKYLDNDARRRERAVAQLEAMLPQLAAQLAQLKAGA